jgi:hypothetical protein
MLLEYYADFSVINWESYVVHNFICLTGKHSIYIFTPIRNWLRVMKLGKGLDISIFLFEDVCT